MTDLNVRNDKHRPDCLDPMRFIETQAVKTRFPAMWSILAPWVDDTITTAYTKGKLTSVKPSAFLKIHNRICTMILPMDKVGKVVPITSASLCPMTSLLR